MSAFHVSLTNRRLVLLAALSLVASLIAVGAHAPAAQAAPGVSVVGSPVAVVEGGATGSYTVVLTEEPTGDVTITVNADSQVSVDKTSLTFTQTAGATPWNVAQTVTVTAVNDTVVEGAHTGTITHTPAGGGYDGVAIDSVTANITDNDTASVTVTGSPVTVVEGGATDTYDVVLDAQPSATVTITVSPDTQVSVNKTTLTFTTSDWDTPQTVTVTAVNDTVVEGAHTGTITHSAAGGGYTGVAIASVTANITDNDTASVTVTGSPVTVVEGGATDTYDVVLDAQPSATVTVTVSPDTQVSVNKTTLTFTTSDWDTPQTVTVTAVNDTVVEGAHTGTITHSAAGGGYTGVAIASVTANITDNDTASVTVTGSPVTVVEGGATDTYDVVLDAQPSATVTVTVSPDTQVSVNKTTLTFTTSDWDTPQTVTVTAVNDTVVEGAHTGTITHSAAGGGYTGVAIASVTANITDNDTASVTVTGSPVTVVEGGATDTYDVVLDAQPSATVTVTVSPDTQVSVNKTTLTFTTSDWDTPQTVTVTAVNDTVVEGAHTGTITHSAAGGGYTGVAIASVTANITDNDTATVAFTNGTSNVQEDTGLPHTPTVTLSTTNGATLGSSVVVDITDATPVGAGYAVGSGNDYTLNTSQVTFTAGSGDGATRDVNITINDDATQEGNEVIDLSMNVTSGVATNGTQTTHTVTIVDDETRNLTITPTAGNTIVAEASGTDTFDVGLTQVPTGTVTVTLTKTTLGTNFNIDKPTLTFTTGNWMIDQTVTVTGVNDDYDNGNRNGVITLSASGGGYNGVVGTEDISITDDDTAGAIISQSSGNTAVTEGGAADTYSVRLTARPTTNVTVNFTYDNTELSVSPTSLIFTTSNWSTAQTVSVTGVGDGIAEPTETHIIGHSSTSADTPFNGLAIAEVSVTVTNSDALQVTIDGPSYGATGIGSTFRGVENASGTGDIVYEWQVIDLDHGNVLLPIKGTESAFTFTPSQGGSYAITVTIQDDVSSTAFYIPFTVLGDLAGSVFTSDIIWLAEEGITKGCNPPVNDQYCPNTNVTRGQMAAFMVRFLHLTDDGSGDLFTDDDGNVFEQNIDILATAGITKGCNPPANTQFCPNDNVTRGQMAAFMVRALGLTDNGGGDLFTDDDGNVFEQNIDILATAGITKGCNPPANTQFCPYSYVTRGQMAAFLHRAASLLP